MRQLTPDFKAIADFRRDNRTAFRKVFRKFVVLCASLDLFGRELIAVDGTRLTLVGVSGLIQATRA
jgi:transposase